MEHGLYVLEGKAVYKLNQDWVEVEAGDFMWLRAYCPQACYAAGPGRFRYLLYKDVNRHAKLRAATACHPHAFFILPPRLVADAGIARKLAQHSGLALERQRAMVPALGDGFADDARALITRRRARLQRRGRRQAEHKPDSDQTRSCDSDPHLPTVTGHDENSANATE